MVFDPKTDFNDLKYKVFSVDNIVENLKEFRKYKVLLSHAGSNRPDMDKLIRYAMVLYDKKSKLIKAFTNIPARKQEAAVIAGYSLTHEMDIIQALYDFEDFDLQLITIEFLKEQHDMYWSLIVSNEQTFYENTKALLTEVRNYKDDKNKMDALNVKAKLMDECDKIATRVETYYLKVFGDGEVQSKAKDLDLSPEAIAQRGKRK